MIAVLSPADVLEHPDPAAWLKSAESSEVSHLDVFLVHQDCHLALPFGSVPLVLGTTAADLKDIKEVDKKPRGQRAKKKGQAGKAVGKQHGVNTTALVVSLCLSASGDGCASPELQRYVASQWVGNSNKIPKDIKEATGVSDWLEGLQKEAPVASAAADGA